jgi:hypothetical protein
MREQKTRKELLIFNYDIEGSINVWRWWNETDRHVSGHDET